MRHASSLREAKALLARSEQLWMDATSYSDLLKLNIAFLKGKIFAHPDVFIEPRDLLREEFPGLAPETSKIREELVSLNMLGFFTTVSQPGLYEKTSRFAIEQRAFVDGYIPRGLVEQLLSIESTELGALVPSYDFEEAPRIVVTRQGGPRARKLKPFTFVGLATPPEQMEGRIGPKALRELTSCRSVSIYDKKWRRNDLLWSSAIRALRMSS